MNLPRPQKKAWPILADPLFWVWVVLFLLYLGLVIIRPRGVFWSLDEGGKLLYIQNVLKTGSPAAPLIYPGEQLDPKFAFVPLFFFQQSGSHIYAWWPVGFPLLTLPLYRLFGWLGLYLLPAAAGATIASLTGGMVRTVTQTRHGRLPVAAALIVGLATPILFYSAMFWEHSLSVLCMLWALWALLIGDKTAKARWVIIAGVAASLAIFLRTEQLFGALALLAILAWRRWRWALLMFVVLGATSSVWLWLNRLWMGNFLSRQWGQDSAALATSLFPGLQEAGWRFVPYVLFNAPRVIAFELNDALLIAGTLLTILCLILPFWRRTWPLLPFVYVGLGGIDAWVLLQTNGYRSVHGLLLIAPHLVAFPWFYRHLRANASHWFAASLVGAVCLFTLLGFLARSWLAAGGQQWGPRYLLVLYPLLVFASVAGLQAIQAESPPRWQSAIWGAYLFLVLLGFGYEWRGQQAVWRTVQNYALTQQAMLHREPVPTLTDCTWLPMVIPALYWRGDLYAQTNHDIAEWKQLLAKQGITKSQYLNMDMCLNAPLNEIEMLRRANPTGIVLKPLE